jgi:hypothetical protein
MLDPTSGANPIRTHPTTSTRPGRIGLTGLLLAAALGAALLTGPAADANAGAVTTSAHHADRADRAARVTAPRKFHGTLSEAVAALRVRAEYTPGYDRDSYKHWISQGDGCDTRDIVLIDENTEPSAVGPDCTYTGRWFSYYDKVSTTDPGTFDIDHLVPLGEADPSGAYRWTSGTKERYANDLGDPRSLVAVTAHSNRSKSDQDVAEWEPDHGKCRYVASWLAVKIRWHLTVDRTEKRAILDRIDACPTRTITVTRARVYRDPPASRIRARDAAARTRATGSS